MQDRYNIPFAHWSLRVGRPPVSGGAVLPFMGEIVTDVDDLHQSIANLVLTPKGSCPTEPEKGCDVMPFIDRHPDVAIQGIERGVFDGLTIWEPRIVLQKVEVTQVDFAHFSCGVFWRPVQSVLDDLIETRLALGSGVAQAA